MAAVLHPDFMSSPPSLPWGTVRTDSDAPKSDVIFVHGPPPRGKALVLFHPSLWEFLSSPLKQEVRKVDGIVSQPYPIPLSAYTFGSSLNFSEADRGRGGGPILEEINQRLAAHLLSGDPGKADDGMRRQEFPGGQLPCSPRVTGPEDLDATKHCPP